MARVHLVTINQSIPPLNQATFQRHSFRVDQILQQTDGQICLNADDGAECAAFIISWVFQTRQRDGFNGEKQTALHREVTQQQLLPWVTRQDTLRISTGSLLTHLTPTQPPPQPPTFKSSITFFLGRLAGAGLCGACRGEADQGREGRWEVLIPSEGGPARLWPSLPALASPLTYHIYPSSSSSSSSSD